MTGLALRAMRWWDIDPVVALEQQLFTDDAWSAGLFWSELAQWTSRHYVVADAAGALIGYAGLAIAGADAYVQTIGVHPDHWGTGVGSVLLADLLAESERRDVGAVLLEVRADNARATRLYERFGFSTAGTRKAYYQPSGADARVMVRGRT